MGPIYLLSHGSWQGLLETSYFATCRLVAITNIDVTLARKMEELDRWKSLNFIDIDYVSCEANVRYPSIFVFPHRPRNLCFLLRGT